MIMEREMLMQKTVRKIEQLPTQQVQKVNDFVEFIIRRTNDAMVTEGLKQLSLCGQTYDFLYDEPDIYSVDDLKLRFA